MVFSGWKVGEGVAPGGRGVGGLGGRAWVRVGSGIQPSDGRLMDPAGWWSAAPRPQCPLRARRRVPAATREPLHGDWRQRKEKSEAQSRAVVPAEGLSAALGLGGAFRHAERPGSGRSVRKVLGSAQRRRRGPRTEVQVVARELGRPSGPPAGFA